MRSEELVPVAEQECLDASELAARLTRTIHGRTGGRVRNLRVDVSPAGIVLSGTASTYYAKQLATQAAFDELTGLQVENEIDVH